MTPPKRIFGQLLRSDVVVHPHPFAHCAGGVSYRDGSRQHPAPIAADVPDAIFGFQRSAFCHDALPLFGDTLTIVRMEHIEPTKSSPLLISLACKRAPGGRIFDNGSIGIGSPDDLCRGLHQCLKTLPTFAQRLLCCRTSLDLQLCTLIEASIISRSSLGFRSRRFGLMPGGLRLVG